MLTDRPAHRRRTSISTSSALRRVSTRTFAAALAGSLLGGSLLAPAAALASGGPGSGGGGLSGPPGSSGTKSGVKPADRTVTATGDGITVHTRESGLTGRDLRFAGTTSTRNVRDVVVIERLNREPGSSWLVTARANVERNGAFSALWRANRSGSFEIRAVLMTPAQANAADRGDRSAPDTRASGTLPLTVYRAAIATLYGPGFYGHRTACGETLRKNTIGVANRTLPCGTRVTVLYGGRTMTVRVIDRGPYANDANWDLTMAAAKMLDIEGTSTIGTVTAPASASS